MQENATPSTSPRRRDPHTKVVLPVRIWGMDSNGSPFVQNVFTVDISARGACVSGVTARLKVGEVVGLQHGAEKARFRIAWVKPIQGVGFNVGMAAVDETKCMWRSHLVIPMELESTSTPADRRRHVRIPCNGSVEFTQTGNSYRMWATATDVSGGGCYLQTVSTMPVNTHIQMKLDVDHLEMNCVATVQTSHPGIGMGVQFRTLDGENQQNLHTILEHLEAAQGDKLPPHMRALAQIERTRECLAMMDQIIRQNPMHMVAQVPESVAQLQDKVNELLRQQRAAVTEQKAESVSS